MWQLGHLFLLKYDVEPEKGKWESESKLFEWLCLGDLGDSGEPGLEMGELKRDEMGVCPNRPVGFKDTRLCLRAISSSTGMSSSPIRFLLCFWNICLSGVDKITIQFNSNEWNKNEIFLTRLYWLLLVLRNALRNAWAVASGSSVPLWVDSPLFGLDLLVRLFCRRNCTPGNSGFSVIVSFLARSDKFCSLPAEPGNKLPGGALCCLTRGNFLSCLMTRFSTCPGSCVIAGVIGSKGEPSTSLATTTDDDAGCCGTASSGSGSISFWAGPSWCSYMLATCSL